MLRTSGSLFQARFSELVSYLDLLGTGLTLKSPTFRTASKLGMRLYEELNVWIMISLLLFPHSVQATRDQGTGAGKARKTSNRGSL